MSGLYTAKTDLIHDEVITAQLIIKVRIIKVLKSRAAPTFFFPISFLKVFLHASNTPPRVSSFCIVSLFPFTKTIRIENMRTLLFVSISLLVSVINHQLRHNISRNIYYYYTLS
jgi:hypothetical protein